MEIDDDIFVIEDNRQKEPTVDPLEVGLSFNEKETNCFDMSHSGHSRKNQSENIINLDSSDEENSSQSKTHPETMITSANNLESNNVRKIGLTQSNLQSVLQQDLNNLLQLNHDIIDLDAEDLDPLAPLRSFMNQTENQKRSNQTTLTKCTLGQRTVNTKKTEGFESILKKYVVMPLSVNSSNQSQQMKSLAQHTKRQTLVKMIKQHVKRSTNKTQVITSSKRPVAGSDIKSKLVRVSKPINKKTKNNQSITSPDTKDRISDSSITRLNFMSDTSETIEVANETSTFSAAEIPKNKLRYVGKIIRIPGQPSLIENSSGVIFRADNSLTDCLSPIENTGEEKNLEIEMNLYRNFFRHQAKTKENEAQDSLDVPEYVHLNDLFIQKSNIIVDTVSEKLPQSEVSSRNYICKKGFPSKNINLVNDFTVKPSISVKKPKQIISTPKNIKEQTIIIPCQPKELGSAVLDLNLNINDTRSTVANPINTLSQSENIFQNDSPGRYNLALDLVLNVNDTNQPNNQYQIMPQNQFTNLNNVALDVSFNVNNKEKPATITSINRQIAPLTQSLIQPDVYRDHLNSSANNTTGETYCCYACSFKTADIKLIKAHKCPFFSSLLRNIHSANTNIMCKKKAVTIPPNKTGDMYCCNLCLLHTSDFEQIKSHKCSKNTLLNLDHDTENSSREKMYCCVGCSFQTENFHVMSCHVCPSVNKISPNKVKTEKVQKLSETENHQEITVTNIYNCVTCSFQVTDLKVMQSHICSTGIETNITLERKSESTKIFQLHAPTTTDKLYQCVSCSFKTTSIELVKSHKCRENAIKQNENSIFRKSVKPNKKCSNNKNKKIKFVCEMCGMRFKTKYILFQHLRRRHFNFHRKFGCYLCTLQFDNVLDLKHHLKTEHRLVDGDIKNLSKREIYKCGACQFETDSIKNMKIHFDGHIKTYLSTMPKLWKPDLQNSEFLTNTKFLYQCNLCGKETNSISIWLKHVCQYQKRYTEEINMPTDERQDQNKKNNSEPVKHITDRPSHTKPSRQLCFYCTKQISKEVLGCENSICEHICHLKCVNAYAMYVDMENINTISNWFCPACQDKNMENLSDAQEDIYNMNCCLDFADKEYLKEMEKQKSMANQLKKMNEEKVTMKTEFDVIKNFIMKCKSDRINNNAVKSVCAILETFINAGIDSND